MHCNQPTIVTQPVVNAICNKEMCVVSTVHGLFFNVMSIFGTLLHLHVLVNYVHCNLHMVHACMCTLFTTAIPTSFWSLWILFYCLYILCGLVSCTAQVSVLLAKLCCCSSRNRYGYTPFDLAVSTSMKAALSNPSSSSPSCHGPYQSCALSTTHPVAQVHHTCAINYYLLLLNTVNSGC